MNYKMQYKKLFRGKSTSRFRETRLKSTRLFETYIVIIQVLNLLLFG